MKIGKILDCGFLIKNDKNKLNLELFIHPSKTSIHGLISCRFFPPSSSTYKGMNSWDYSPSNPNQKFYNTNNVIFYNLAGFHGVQTLLSSLKNVQVNYDEYQERGESEVGMFDLSTQDGYEKMYEWHRKGNLRLEDINNGWSWDNGYDQGLSTEQKYWLKHTWGDGEIYHADSYKDITVVYDGKGSKEYYSTPEIIEVLEKWIEALERWNNPEERQKMIEEYGANERKKDPGFSRLKKWIKREGR